MTVISSASSSGASSTSTTSTSNASSGQSLDQNAFLKLLITQLKYQDPTNPMDDQQFVSQMAQFSSLQQMTTLNEETQQALTYASNNQAVSLMGRTVTVTNPTGGDAITGVVDGVNFSTDGAMITINGTKYDASAVLSVK